MHWCHGAPALPSLCLAALGNEACTEALGRRTLIEAALRAGAVIWERGVLRKGNGLCHGVAGNAYAFLALERVLRLSGSQGGDDGTEAANMKAAAEQQLLRARCFAALLVERDVQSAMAATSDPQRRVRGVPDSPLSLMEGTAGVLCFLLDLSAECEALHVEHEDVSTSVGPGGGRPPLPVVAFPGWEL